MGTVEVGACVVLGEGACVGIGASDDLLELLLAFLLETFSLVIVEPEVGVIVGGEPVGAGGIGTSDDLLELLLVFLLETFPLVIVDLEVGVIVGGETVGPNVVLGEGACVVIGTSDDLLELLLVFLLPPLPSLFLDSWPFLANTFS